jgi:adenylate cyclase, class 2
MSHTNIEIKARCLNPEAIEATLKAHNARFIGLDHQIDTYFNTPNGRLKLREGNIENALIFYNRPNQAGPKQSDIILYKTQPHASLKAILIQSNGILTIVDKKRQIFFIENVKFHLDTVEGLGNFVEIEAIDEHGDIGYEQLLKQCTHYKELFNIQEADLMTDSYSDMIMTMGNG